LGFRGFGEGTGLRREPARIRQPSGLQTRGSHQRTEDCQSNNTRGVDGFINSYVIQCQNTVGNERGHFVERLYSTTSKQLTGQTNYEGVVNEAKVGAINAFSLP
jgi:hypothetical protein